MSSGLRLVTTVPSVTTSLSTQFAPAFLRSVFRDGHDVIVRPRTAPASTRVHRPRQIAATRFAGFCQMLHRLNRFRDHSKPIRIHDSTRKQKRVVVFALADCNCTSTGTSWPHSFMIPSLHFAFHRRDNLRVAPASSRALRGSNGSACSNPSLTGIANPFSAKTAIHHLLHPL